MCVFLVRYYINTVWETSNGTKRFHSKVRAFANNVLKELRVLRAFCDEKKVTGYSFYNARDMCLREGNRVSSWCRDIPELLIVCLICGSLLQKVIC